MKQIGGKSQAGLFQWIINRIPDHSTYIEPFFGSGAIMRLKAPAPEQIGVDKMPPRIPLPAGAVFFQGCGIAFLERRKWLGGEFVYLDPPYVLSTRGGRRYYAHELTDQDHRRLLKVIRAIPAKVMISGYHSGIYDVALGDWHLEELHVMTRGNTAAVECLWMNYAPPALPMDVRYFGKDYRDRLRLKRKMKRWLDRLAALPEGEREFLIAALAKLRAADPSAIPGAAGHR